MAYSVSFGPTWPATRDDHDQERRPAQHAGVLVSRLHRVRRFSSLLVGVLLEVRSGSSYSGSEATSRSTPSCSSEGIPANGSPGPPAPNRRRPPGRRHRILRPTSSATSAGRRRAWPRAAPRRGRRPSAEPSSSVDAPAPPRPRTRPPGPAPRRRAAWWPGARRGCRRRRPCAGRAARPGRPAQMVDRRWAMISVVRPSMRTRRPAWMVCSTWTSMALVASSRTSTGGLTRRVRAMAMRWRCPPDSV